MTDQNNPQPDPGASPPAQGSQQDAPIPKTPEETEQMLAYAWYQFNNYDRQSAKLKGSYRRVRLLIIVISWLTTLIAVFSAITDPATLVRSGFIIAALVFALIGLRFWLAYDKDKEKREKARKDASQRALPANPKAPAPDKQNAKPEPTAPTSWWGRLRHGMRFRYNWYALGWFGLTVLALAISLGAWDFVQTTSAAMPILAETSESRGLLFSLLLVALPLISTVAMTYATNFESGRAWVGIRIGAETIRRGIYSLRVKRWLEGDKLTSEHLTALNKHIIEASENLEKMGVTTPSLTAEQFDANRQYKPNNVDVEDKDQGYEAIDIKEYIEWRLVPQTNWYRGRSTRDYHYTRVYRVIILGVGALGAFLAAAQLGELVAVTVAMVGGLNALLGLQQHEYTYNIYLRTIQKLENRFREFYIISDKEVPQDVSTLSLDKKKVIGKFVTDIEDIFAEERELWKMSVIQGQEATEGALAQMVSAYSTDFDPDELMRGPGSEDENGDNDGE